MNGKHLNAQCVNIFKDIANKNAAFSKLWAEIINQLEQTKCNPVLENTSEIRYNRFVQSRSYRNQKIEESDK